MQMAKTSITTAACPTHPLSLSLMASPQLQPLPKSVKQLADSDAFSSVLPIQYLSRDAEAPADDVDTVLEGEVPTIDLAALTAGTPSQRAEMVRKLGQACEDWGFFMVVNHGVPERLRESIIEAMMEFYSLPEEEKAEYGGKPAIYPIRYGTSFNVSVEKARFWRDYLKVYVHPEFHSPEKPPGLREVLKEYSTWTRGAAMELLRGVWESLGLEEGEMKESLGLSSCYQVFVANLYPPCPQPELAMGLPSHSDYGLLTLLYQNGIDGLEIKHRNKWLRIKPLPNSFLVNTGDHMEIVSNGKYKSVLHRAAINGESTRMSIVTVIAPSMEALVEPAPKFVTSERPALFQGMLFKEYLESYQKTHLQEKAVLDFTRRISGLEK